MLTDFRPFIQLFYKERRFLRTLSVDLVVDDRVKLFLNLRITKKHVQDSFLTSAEVTSNFSQ